MSQNFDHCFLCNERLNLNKLKNHLIFCVKRFINRSYEKPPADRNQIPQPPPHICEILPKDLLQKMKEYNKQSFNSFNEKVKNRCRYCLRLFNVHELSVHQYNCNEQKMLNSGCYNQSLNLLKPVASKL